jgi:hypothetical protein
VRRAALFLLLVVSVVALAPVAALALETGCAEECPAACGDCGQCPVSGETPAAERLGTVAPAPAVAPAAPERACAAPSRAVEHVPLRRG